VQSLASECANRQVEWQIGELSSVECDPGLMEQVFVNLLSNAVKYTRKREHAVIQVGENLQNGERVIFVRDNGVGFEMQYVGKLFGVFQRLHKASDFEGTGVGLAITQRIIRKHGGRIWAEAVLNQGATFFFTSGPPENDRNKKAGWPIVEEEQHVP
jgi:light-regulated signal transduction histidine kinase (bacteriophytochrome)